MDMIFGTSNIVTVRHVRLQWERLHIQDDPNPSFEGIPEQPGVYSFEACHDSRPTKGVLYIGQTQGKQYEGSLHGEIQQRYYTHFAPDKSRLYSDNWDITVRWALINNKSIITPIERLLIIAHAASFNAQESRGVARPEDRDLLITNEGYKGRMLPIVFGEYLL